MFGRIGRRLRRSDGGEASTYPEKSKRTFPLIKSLEGIAKRVVSIEMSPNDSNLAKCNLQEQSSLFNKLPAELRALIFEHATAPYDDPENRYNNTDFYYQPEHLARHITSYSLLLTCRRIWLEANHLPMQQGDHSFWFRDPGRRPKYLDNVDPNDGLRIDRRYTITKFMIYNAKWSKQGFIHTMTIINRKSLKHVHLYAQMIWLEESLHVSLPLLLGSYGVCPEVLTITIKHTDWWWWEEDLPLALKDAWIWQLLKYPALPRLRKIRVEFETLESKMAELRPILSTIREKFDMRTRVDHFGDISHVELQEAETPRTWSGPTSLGGTIHPHYKDLKKLDYRIATLVWEVTSEKRRSASDPGAENDCKRLTHIPGPQLPVPNIDHPDREVSSRNIGVDEYTAEHIMQAWRQRGSLLKFVQSIPSAA